MTVFKTIEELIEENNSFITAIPNNMGINLVSVKGIEYDYQEDGQIKEMKIIFIPSKEELKQICDNCKIEISKYGCACGGKPKQETRTNIGVVKHKTMSNVNREHQEELFNEIVAMKHSMQGLAGFVQNDFERMLADGTTTPDGITEAIADMDESFDNVIEKLNSLREKCREVMTHYSSLQ
jgi:hypothetical protein